MLELNFSDCELEEITAEASLDIAVIGMDVRLPMADNLDEFWHNLAGEKDCVGDLPASRKRDIEQYLKYRDGSVGQIRYGTGGYLKRIDRFDNEFFKISNKEASLMDPNQRIFLESAWKAIEDSGYGGKKLVGTRTGVYVGFTPRGEYRRFITEIEPESLAVAETGNLSSIVASRIAYLLDLRGPSMIVNTECSSSLVAVHLACKSLRNGECDMAIAGGVRLSFSPVATDQKLGIESDQGKVCTFDDDSDGAVFGEGSVAIILKPYYKAARDGDQVYAVIKGSAVNQDGASVGITAPNLLAQEDVIVNAWKDANIDPETITYIEVHGTGTKLGDPVEVNGIARAFRQFTDKKQFCGVGSLKTNIAHLDNVAGIASLVKAVLALQHKKLPPTLHFRKPNRKIAFEDSPVYVNNRLSDWEPEGMPRRCGVSSFGLSGTNCHVILEEAPEAAAVPGDAGFGREIVTVSAMKREIGLTLVKALREHLLANPDQELPDISYTANTGRGHYGFRIAVAADTRESLLEALAAICGKGLERVEDPRVYWGEHSVIPDHKKLPEKNEIYDFQKKELGAQAAQLTGALGRKKDLFQTGKIEELCRLYAKGADVDWEELYASESRRRISLPTYPFEEKRCWLAIPDRPKSRAAEAGVHYGRAVSHPLLDECVVESVTEDIYRTRFQVSRHWVLAEHHLIGKYLLPGTAYLEMARECGSRYLPEGMEFRNVAFLNSLVVDEEETREIETVLHKKDGHLEFAVAGRAEGGLPDGSGWVVYCEGKLYPLTGAPDKGEDFRELKARCVNEVDLHGSRSGEQEQDIAREFQFGPRWTQVMQGIFVGDEEVFAELALPEQFAGDLEEYYLHPSMLDMAVNAITQNTGNGIYLPLSYDSFKLYKSVPKALFSYVKKVKSSKNAETVTFNVRLFDADQEPVADITHLTVKKVHQREKAAAQEERLFYRLGYEAAEPIPAERYYSKEKVLVFRGEGPLQEQIAEALGRSGRTVIEASIGGSYGKTGENRYTIRNEQEDYNRLLEELKSSHIEQVVHLLTASDLEDPEGLRQLEEAQALGADSLFRFVQACTHNQLTDPVDLVVVSDSIRYVTPEQQAVHAANGTLLGLCKVVNAEYSSMNSRVLDIDQAADADIIASEINAEGRLFYTAYRGSKRYVELLEEAELTGNTGFAGLLKEEGAYVITGGLGALAREIAAAMAEAKRVNLALIGRRAWPAGESGSSGAGGDAKRAAMDAFFRRVRESGSTVEYYRADVADEAALSGVLDKIRSRFGRINGIVHTAGMAGDGYLAKKSPDSFNRVLQPKVHGTYLLDRLTERDELDFHVLFSSISSVIGYPGQSDYAAANAYLDSFAGHARLKGKKALAINWAPWKETGMAVDYGLSDEGIFRMLPTRTAVEAFQRALCHLEQGDTLIIGRLDMGAVAAVRDAIPFKLSPGIRQRIEAGGKPAASPRPILSKEAAVAVKGKAQADYSGTEMVLAQIWGNVLGMQDVNIYGNFMDLGGDSILAVGLLKDIEKHYPGVVSISDIFSYPSVSEMAGFIEGKTAPAKKAKPQQTAAMKGKKDKELLDILEQLEKGVLSPDEAGQLI